MHVHQCEVNFVGANEIQGLFAALGHQCVVTLRRHDLAQSFSRNRVIVGDQDRVGLTGGHEEHAHNPPNARRDGHRPPSVTAVTLVNSYARLAPLPLRVTPPSESRWTTLCKTVAYNSWETTV